jgi:hypothetical protein
MIRRMLRRRLGVGLLAASGLFCACSESKPPPERAVDRGSSAPSSFVDKAWKVSESTSVAPGTVYEFKSDGTLLVTSPHSTPMVGSWKMENGAMTMVEEGLSYRTEILESGPNVLRLRSHNPGEPVEMTLVPLDSGN